jgi:hypothetical protein
MCELQALFMRERVRYGQEKNARQSTHYFAGTSTHIWRHQWLRFDGDDQEALPGQVNPLVRLEPCHVGFQREPILL